MNHPLVDFLFFQVYRRTQWQNPALLDYFLVPFNSIEAVVWFVCSVFVFRRSLRPERDPIEFLYAFLFLIFGVTDVIEVFILTSSLVWAKTAILIALFVIRQRVLRHYVGKYIYA